MTESLEEIRPPELEVDDAASSAEVGCTARATEKSDSTPRSSQIWLEANGIDPLGFGLLYLPERIGSVAEGEVDRFSCQSRWEVGGGWYIYAANKATTGSRSAFLGLVADGK